MGERHLRQLSQRDAGLTMANWNLEAIFGLGNETEPAPQPPKPRRKPDVKGCWVVVAHPSGKPGDVGKTVAAHWIVEHGILYPCDEAGKIGEKSHVLAPGDEPRAVASRMARAAYHREQPRSAFNRRLSYPDLGIV
jgi:hypothetical protein